MPFPSSHQKPFQPSTVSAFFLSNPGRDPGERRRLFIHPVPSSRPYPTCSLSHLALIQESLLAIPAPTFFSTHPRSSLPKLIIPSCPLLIPFPVHVQLLAANSPGINPQRCEQGHHDSPAQHNTIARPATPTIPASCGIGRFYWYAASIFPDISHTISLLPAVAVSFGCNQPSFPPPSEVVVFGLQLSLPFPPQTRPDQTRLHPALPSRHPSSSHQTLTLSHPDQPTLGVRIDTSTTTVD